MYKIEKRDAWKSLVLTFVTCGLYSYYWYFKMMESIGIIKEDGSNDFWKWLGLTIITCGIYNIYWMYKTAQFLYDKQVELAPIGTPVSNRKWFYICAILISACGLPLAILIPVYMQQDINAIADMLEAKEANAEKVEVITETETLNDEQ